MTSSTRPADDLKPILSLFDSIMINVGTIVASAIFLVPKDVAAALPSPSAVVAVWIVGGIISLLGAICIAELAGAMPRAGGQYVYLTRAYGPAWGFLYGWTAFFLINTTSIAAISMAFAQYTGELVPLTPTGKIAVAVASTLLLTAINGLGVKLGARTLDILTVIKIAALVLLAVGGFSLIGTPDSSLHLFAPGSADVSPTWRGAGTALVAVLWAYDGWIELTYVGSEVAKPERNVHRSIIFSTVLVIGLFVLVNLAYMAAIPLDAMKNSQGVAADAARVILGPGAAVAVAAVIAISTFGSNHAVVLTSARISYAMAREKLFFRPAGIVHPLFGTPVNALLIQAVWATVLTLTGSYQQLFSYVVFASWVFYALSCGALLILRSREPELPRPYRVWGYPWVPGVFILVAIAVTLTTVAAAPRESAIGAGIIVLGLPVYALLKRREAK